MQKHVIIRIGLISIGVGAVSVVVGILTGVTLGCTLIACPSTGTGFRGFGINGVMLVYYLGCNACTISPWVVLGGFLSVIGLAVVIGGSRLHPRTQSA